MKWIKQVFVKENFMNCTKIGTLRVRKQLHASDGSTVRMTVSGFYWLKSTFKTLARYFKNLIGFAILWLAISSTGLAMIALPLEGVGSWYSSQDTCKYNPQPKCPTASGESLYELEKNKEKFAAMWSVPLGSRVRVCNQSNQRCVEVTVRDRGPAKRLRRIIDLSQSAFKEIANPKEGVINVSVEVLA